MANKAPDYGTTARIQHWLGAAVVLSMIPVGVVMVQEGLPRALQNALFIYHKNLGVLALILIVLRLVWRFTHPVAAAPAPTWQQRASRASHAALYALMVVLPLSGYIRVRAGGFPIEVLDAWGVPPLVPRSDQLATVAQSVHYYAGIVLGALIVLHLAAVVHHVFVRRDGLMRRIWPPVGGGRSA